MIAIPHYPESLAGSSRLRSPGNSVQVQSRWAHTHGGAFLRARRRAEFISPVKSHSRGKPRECTVAGCKDAVVHGRADQGMYRVNDFDGNAWSVRAKATCRRDATCYCDRAAGVTVPTVSLAVYVHTCGCVHTRIILHHRERMWGGKKARIKHDECRATPG